jgi:hypothetical protein
MVKSIVKTAIIIIIIIIIIIMVHPLGDFAGLLPLAPLLGLPLSHLLLHTPTPLRLLLLPPTTRLLQKHIHIISAHRKNDSWISAILALIPAHKGGGDI